MEGREEGEEDGMKREDEAWLLHCRLLILLLHVNCQFPDLGHCQLGSLTETTHQHLQAGQGREDGSPVHIVMAMKGLRLAISHHLLHPSPLPCSLAVLSCSSPMH